MKRKLAAFIFCLLVVNVLLVAQNAITGDSITHELFGTISAKKGAKIKIALDEVNQKLPQVNTAGDLMKKFEKELLGTLMTGWLTIGKVRFDGKENMTAGFTLIEEKSVITVDGVKEDHFIAGQKVKFSWKELATEDEKFFNMGMNELDNNMIKALGFFKQAVAVNPGHAEAWNMIGMIQNESKVYDSAVFFYTKAYQLDTSNIKYIKNIAVTNTFLNNFSDAYWFSSKAVLHGPADAEARYLRAMTYFYLLNENISETQKKQILSDLDYAVSVDVNDSFYIKERMVIRSYFKDTAGACEDAKKYKAIEGEAGDEFVKQYCKE